MKQLSENFIAMLIATAKIELPVDDEDDFNPADVAGGNFDDAYYAGEEAGEVQMAREILNELGVDYE